VREKPLATTIERDIVPESLEIDGASRVNLDLDDELAQLNDDLDDDQRPVGIASGV
jgi:hypothetical protein